MKPIKSSKLHPNIKPITSYVTTAFIGFMFMVFYDTRFGVSFMAALALAPFISYLLIRNSVKQISVDVSVSHQTVYKGEIIDMTVAIRGDGIFPVPFVHVELFNGQNLTRPETDKYLISLSAGKPSVIKQSYEAKIWGNVELGIKEIVVLDYLGLFNISLLPDNPETVYVKNIEICPSIYDLQTNELITAACNELTFDENEETQTNVKNSFISMPGYEHRPYVPGDALKRINWRLSAKMDKYMVRELEPLGSNKQVLLLDCCGLQSAKLPAETQRAALLSEERTVEAVLSILMSMYKQGVACTLYFFNENHWQEFAVEDETDVLSLQYAFAKYKFLDLSGMLDRVRIPMDIINEKRSNSSMILFTCSLDYKLCTELSDIKDTGVSTNVVCPDKPKNVCENMWVVNEFYDFYALQGGGEFYD